MIADLKPYPVMKDSGVPWLGEVPEHWEVGTLRRKLRPYDGIKIGPFGSQLKLDQMSTSGYKVYGQANVIARDFARGTKFVDEQKFDELSACEVRSGDMVVTMMGTSGRCARVPDTAATGIMDSHLLRLRTDGSIDVSFAALVIDEAPYVKEQISVAGKGSIMRGLNSGMIKDLVLAFPALPEQAAIVRFLDHADRRTRCYIRAKQKLIKLLEEQKQAIIHRAVTRGLDRNVRLKPSRVEWLGDVPEHWQLLPLKRACSLLRDGTHLPPPRQAEGFPLLSVRNIVSDSFVRRPDDSRISESHFNDLCRSFTPQRDDVLLAIVGATLGKAAIVPKMDPFHIQRSLAILRPRARLLDFRFLAAFLRGPGFQRALWTTVAFSAQPGIYLNTLCSFYLVLPPISEQQTIIAELDGSTGQLARAMLSAHREITLLREYRTRLIADVVTGKLDVREAAARLPHETEELEPLDEADALTDAGEDVADDLNAFPEEAEA